MSLRWTLSSEGLQHIVTRTLAHYEHNAQSYWEGTPGLKLVGASY